MTKDSVQCLSCNSTYQEKSDDNQINDCQKQKHKLRKPCFGCYRMYGCASIHKHDCERAQRLQKCMGNMKEKKKHFSNFIKTKTSSQLHKKIVEDLKETMLNNNESNNIKATTSDRLKDINMLNFTRKDISNAKKPECICNYDIYRYNNFDLLDSSLIESSNFFEMLSMADHL